MLTWEASEPVASTYEVDQDALQAGIDWVELSEATLVAAIGFFAVVAGGVFAYLVRG